MDKANELFKVEDDKNKEFIMINDIINELYKLTFMDN